MKCKKCGKEFTPRKGLINYCSLSCRNSRIITEEHKQKTSKSLKGRKGRKKSIEEIKSRAKKVEETWNKKILEADFNSLSFDGLRKRIILEQNKSCASCGISKWLDKDISFEIDHKDGNNTNNKRNNLEALCPNCHSLTANWRGRNKNSNRKRVSDEDLANAILDHNYNFRQALLSVHLTAKGGNYVRCHKLKRIMLSKL